MADTAAEFNKSHVSLPLSMSARLSVSRIYDQNKRNPVGVCK